MSHLPPQHPPVKRPDLIHPHRAVDVDRGTETQVVKVRIDLLHGANYNDPPYYRHPAYQVMVPTAWSGR